MDVSASKYGYGDLRFRVECLFFFSITVEIYYISFRNIAQWLDIHIT